jgi:hypothetical protein
MLHPLDCAYSAVTGKLAASERMTVMNECAASNYRAGGGRITMDQARSQCAGDINAILRINDAEADAAQPWNPKTQIWPWLVGGALLFGGLYLIERR